MVHKGNGGHMDVIERLYADMPGFSDIFTEESFYVFATCFVIGTIATAFILSRFITIKSME